jgi:hypothetical protein
VLKPEAEPEEHQQAEVSAVIWLEGANEDVFDRDDADTLSELADYVGIALDRPRRLEDQIAKERHWEREGILAELSRHICNPLQVAQTSLDLLVARLSNGETLKPDELVRQSRAILRGVEQAAQVAHQLREGVGRRVVTLKPTDIGAVIADVVEAFLPHALKASTQVVTEVPKQLPPLKLDSGEMCYVLECMLENSLEAIERKRAECDGQPIQGRIAITATADPTGNKDVMLRMTDNGCGIPEADASRVFDRDFTTKTDNRGEREGLGLYEARRFVAKAGGEIEVLRTSQEGTEFRINFPVCAGDAIPMDVEF